MREKDRTIVHGRVGGICGKARAVLDGDALGHPTGGGRLGARLQGTPGDKGEADALHSSGIEAATFRRLPQGPADAKTCEERIEHEGAAVAARIDDFDIKTRPGRYGLGRVEEAADRGYEAPQCLAVDLVGAAEAVDDLGHGSAGIGVALVVGELQITDHRAVSVAPPCLP